MGPFVKGESLGFSLSEWLAGTASGSYKVDSGVGTLEFSAENLVPDGVYTVWCSRIKLPPEPLVIDMPCGALDGSENVFEADANGKAEFNLVMNALEPSTQSTVNVLALAYHSDGNTFGAYPGPFGSNTHVQLFFLMPPQ